MLVWWNGEFVSLERAALPITDALVQRGVGVFDLARSMGRGLVQLSAHVTRLLDSARAVCICPLWTPDRLKEIARACRAQLEGEVLVKLFITGGDHLGPEGFDRPRLFATVEPLQLPSTRILRDGVRLCPLDRGRGNPQAKTVDYAASFLVHRLDPEAYEALYCPDGLITEAAHSSFFGLQGDRLYTAPDELVLPGTTRQLILDFARREGLQVCFEALRLEGASELDEAFISGSVKGVVPVVALGDRVVGSGRVGERTKKIAARLQEQLAAWAE